MKRVIYKYPLPAPELAVNRVDLPAGAKILNVGVQGPDHDIVLWAEVDPERDAISHRVAVVGTGWPMDFVGPGMNYVGTVFIEWMVFHIYLD